MHFSKHHKIKMTYYLQMFVGNSLIFMNNCYMQDVNVNKRRHFYCCKTFGKVSLYSSFIFHLSLLSVNTIIGHNDVGEQNNILYIYVNSFEFCAFTGELTFQEQIRISHFVYYLP